MKGTNFRIQIALLFAALVALAAPSSAFAGSISATISANSVNSLGSFQVKMNSTGVTSCTWSRLDNGTTWQWQNQPLSGTTYDSGVISGWAGAATYEWQFDCSDNFGSSYFAAISVSISAESGSIIDDVTETLASVIDSVVDTVLPPDPVTTPLITVLPTPVVFPDTDTTSSNNIHLIVSNTGGTGSLLSGSISIAGDPSFTCISGCTYTNVLPGPGPDVVIHFEPTTIGQKTAIASFSGGGGTTVPLSGTGITPTAIVVASPLPIIDVSPAHTLLFYGVELGDTRDKVFTVTNVGPAGTLLSGVVSIPAGSDFHCHSGCIYTNIGTTASHDVTIRFTPSGSPGTKIATVNFTGGGGASRFVNGDGYSLSISGSLDFGNVLLGQSKTLLFTVTNPSNITSLGSGTLVVPPPFSCVGSCIYNLPASAHQNFNITFTPTYLGPASGTGSLSGYTQSSFNFTGNAARQYLRVQER